MTSDPPLDNTIHLTVEKALNTIDMSKKIDKQITQDDNHADISDSPAHQVIFKKQLQNPHVHQRLLPPR